MKGYLLPVALLVTAFGLTGCPSNTQVTLPPPGSKPVGVLFVGNGYAVTPANRGLIFEFGAPVTSTSTPNFTLTAGNSTSALESFAQDSTYDYVADCNDGLVRAALRPLSGTSTQAFTLTATGVGPDGLAADAAGNLYAGNDCGDEHIDVWSAPVSSSSTISASVTDAANIVSLQQIAIDNTNHLFYEAQCNSSKQILEYTLPLSSASTAAVTVSIAGDSCDEGIAIDPQTNQLFVASDATNKIYAFTLPISSSSTPALTITTSNAAQRWQNIAFDTAGNLYATDVATNAIDVFVPPFSASSNPAFSLTPAGIDKPWGLAIFASQ